VRLVCGWGIGLASGIGRLTMRMPLLTLSRVTATADGPFIWEAPVPGPPNERSGTSCALLAVCEPGSEMLPPCAVDGPTPKVATRWLPESAT
jgi:hypothetical protein